MKFIDLFAGLGGFHLALRRLGHECVFASEIDADLADLYSKNYGIRPQGDIRKVPVSDIPRHDVLCAGSPCQPFSKAGDQQGLACPKWGDLLEYVLRIARAHKPEFVLLENVPNLQRHDDGGTWLELEKAFKRAGYDIGSALLSPHQFGIPQIRERLFIVGARSGLSHFNWPLPHSQTSVSVGSILDKNPAEARPISMQLRACLDVWQRFLKRFPKDEELPWFPIWTAEFGATYPFEDQSPSSTPLAELQRRRGTHGVRLRGKGRTEILDELPSYARGDEKVFPDWKKRFIRLNRELYRAHRAWIDEWLPSLKPFHSSLQKLEWHCKGEVRDIWRYVLQIRASGVRVKRPTTAPSLVAMTTTQVPIIAWERRYMTPRECARLQSLDELPNLPEVSTRAFKALGNAVNADLIALIGQNLLQAPQKPSQRASTETHVTARDKGERLSA